MDYIINIQFAAPQEMFDKEAEEAVTEAIEAYNSLSITARNPKEIKQHSYSRDRKTLTVLLRSQAELPYPSKALRLFSSYLVEHGLGSRIYGKNLFRMAPKAVDAVAPSVQKMEENEHTTVSEQFLDFPTPEEFSGFDAEKKLDVLYELIYRRFRNGR